MPTITAIGTIIFAMIVFVLFALLISGLYYLCTLLFEKIVKLNIWLAKKLLNEELSEGNKDEHIRDRKE